ncbi:MAG: hypothetical protein KKE86_02990, partial [Planctomycetes bacterium]|nr:hypothetical protein [Planctomycetota bacterium]
MSESPVNVDRVLDLAEAIFDNSASESEFVELDAILLTDRISRGRYLDYCRMQVALRLEMRSHRATQKVHQQIDIESAVSAPIDSNIMMGEAPSTMPGNSPVLGFLGSAYHGTVGFFSQELPLSCLIAAVIMGAAMLGAWAYKITPHQHIATAPSKSVPSDARPEFVFVGRITGLVDVKWSDDPNYLPPLGFGAVPLGRKYKLDAGLMEITYD